MFFDENFFQLSIFFKLFKIFSWLGIRIPIRSDSTTAWIRIQKSTRIGIKWIRIRKTAFNDVLFDLFSFCMTKNKGAKLSHCWMLHRHNQKIEDEKKHQMVPFREAKLTRLIKTFFR